MTDNRYQNRAEFRANPRQSGLIAVVSGALLALAVLAVMINDDALAGSGAVWKAALAVGGMATLAGVFAWLWRFPPVVLRIGPEGMFLPFGFRRPLPWNDMSQVRVEAGRGVLFSRRRWLVVTPKPGVIPDFRLPGPRRLEQWRLQRFGLRIPLGSLDAPPDEVLEAIGRHIDVGGDRAQ